MSITSSDLKLFAATYPIDTATGGGRMTATVVQTGTENNVFPDIDAAARASGRVQMRKVFMAVTSTDASTLMGAQGAFSAGSSDANVDVVAMPFGDANTLRQDAAAALQADPISWGINIGYTPYLPVSGQPNQVTVSVTPPIVGSLVAFGSPGADTSDVFVQLVTWVTAVSGSTVTFADPVPVGMLLHVNPQLPSGSSTARAVAVATLTATSGSSSVRVNRMFARVVPSITPYPATVNGLSDPSKLKPYGGRVPIFRAGDAVAIRNGSTIEIANVATVDYTGGLTFTGALANSYASGSVVCALMPFGDLQASVGPSFTQQTWTRSWADTILGNPIGLSYNTIAGSITTTNAGAETERWAIVFTSATAFNLIGESLGQIASGTTATAFSPVNPITNSPYFTIAVAGWGTGWAIGNVLRFNTTGARAPIWLTRCVSPSSAGSVNTPSIEMRGTVNA